LLGKATEQNVNPLALQAKADLEGAYDARSLCHNVIVPFERTFLSNALGGSNEPYLNKPARFTQLSLENAVRGGKDTEVLKALIEVLSAMDTSKKAMEYLACGLEVLKRRIHSLAKVKEVGAKYDPTVTEIFDFILKLIKDAQDGESCVLVVATLEKLYYGNLGSRYHVEAHKANQSGASSQEIGDIDLYLNEGLLYSIEVKDKDFNKHDFDHAVKKVITAGGNKVHFIYGLHANYDKKEICIEIDRYNARGVLVTLSFIVSYTRLMLLKIEMPDRKSFLKTLTNVAIEINIKDSTQKRLQEVIQSLGWDAK
jgi:hypothetical protein